jgi:hypothetical protein
MWNSNSGSPLHHRAPHGRKRYAVCMSTTTAHHTETPEQKYRALVAALAKGALAEGDETDDTLRAAGRTLKQLGADVVAAITAAADSDTP